MYNWRRLSDEQRLELLEYRQRQGQPWHGPPKAFERNWYHISATCYEHAPLIGQSPARMGQFTGDLLRTVRSCCGQVTAWCVLPNHYHLLVQCFDVEETRKRLGRLHGSTSRRWNLEDETPGRKCWHRCLPKPIKNLGHRFATLNYIHQNPIHHRYAEQWQDWPFSSAEAYLKGVGREQAERVWLQYPIDKIGRGWDEPGL